MGLSGGGAQPPGALETRPETGAGVMTFPAMNYVSSQAPPAQAATSFSAVWSACSSSCL